MRSMAAYGRGERMDPPSGPTRLQAGARPKPHINSFALSSIARVQGKLAMADQATRDFITASEQRGLPGSALWGEAQTALQQVWFTGDTSRALAMLEEALARRPLAGISPAERPYSMLASAYAVAGRPPGPGSSSGV
jgi:hypothetical protein